MSLYEITFLTKEETDPGVKTLIEAAGGQITDESSLGKRRLAYPIQKETQAVYTTYVFSIEPVVLAELNRKLSLKNEVMRYLLTVKPLEREDKEVSKTVREAIEQAENLVDATEESKAETVVAEPVIDGIIAEEPVPVAEEPVTEEPKTKPTRKPRAKQPETAVEATEEDRLKALEDKLSDILKD